MRRKPLKLSLAPVEQCLLAGVSDDSREGGYRYQLEIALMGDRWRRIGIIPSDGAGLFRQTALVSEQTPLLILLDWLEENADRLEGMPAEVVMHGLDAVRRRGNWL